MTNYICGYLIKCLIFVFLAFLPISSMGAGGKMNVEVIVFNYTSKAVSEITIQGQYMGGYYQEYGSGGTGGKIYCCINVRPGAADVQWEYDREPGDPIPVEGFVRKVHGLIPLPGGSYKYLGVHIYPDDSVKFSLTRDLPEEDKEGRH